MASPSRGSAISTYFRECFSQPYYLWFFFSFALTNLAFLPINLFYIYYCKSMNMGMGLLGKYGTAQLFLSLLQAYPLGWLCDKFHPIRVTIFALVAYATAIWRFFVIHDIPTLGIAQVICGTLAGMWGTATAPLGPMLLPKVKFATYASAMGIVSSILILIVSPLCGKVLDLLNHDYRYISCGRARSPCFRSSPHSSSIADSWLWAGRKATWRPNSSSELDGVRTPDEEPAKIRLSPVWQTFLSA